MYGIFTYILVDFYGKCRVNIPYMEHMEKFGKGNVGGKNTPPKTNPAPENR